MKKFRITHYFDSDETIYFDYCDSLEEASKLHRDFIERNNLGSSDMTIHSGMVYDIEIKKEVAYISYNGRIWTSDTNNFINVKNVYDYDMLMRRYSPEQSLETYKELEETYKYLHEEMKDTDLYYPDDFETYKKETFETYLETEIEDFTNLRDFIHYHYVNRYNY